ncbi:MAG: SGNH/GDSL hydrolase family protein [SAR324 cluster bacterium]|nr:SGNH/GDSL hydrolase family protein [SAR324 cluster bacterium]
MIWRLFAIRICALLIWCFFLIVVLEIVGFIYFQLPFVKPIGGYGYPRELFVAKNGVDYGYQPGYKGEFLGGGYKDALIQINSHGFRDTEFPIEKSNRKRLFVLGDSVVFGAGVGQRERFTEYLEELQEQKKNPLEIFNLGVSGYSYWHYARLLELPLIDELRPDALLVAFTLNDIQQRDSVWPTKMLKIREQQQTIQRWEEKIRFWMDDLYSIQLLKQFRQQLLFYRMTHDEQEAYHTKWMRKQRSNWENEVILGWMQDNIQRSLEIAKAHNIPLAIIILPEMNDLKDPEQFGWARNRLYHYLNKVKIPFCDLHKRFRKVPPWEPYFLSGDSLHFSQEGHRLAARFIADCLDQFGY